MRGNKSETDLKENREAESARSRMVQGRFASSELRIQGVEGDVVAELETDSVTLKSHLALQLTFFTRSNHLFSHALTIRKHSPRQKRCVHFVRPLRPIYPKLDVMTINGSRLPMLNFFSIFASIVSRLSERASKTSN